MMPQILFKESLVHIDLDVSSQEELFEILAKPLFDEGVVLPGFLEGVKEREKNFPTGLPTVPFGAAIPHTNPQYVKQNAISVGVLKNPIEFTVMGTDDETTQVRLVLLLALNESQKQLNILKNITNIISDENLMTSIPQMDVSEIYKVILSNLKGVIENE